MAISTKLPLDDAERAVLWAAQHRAAEPLHRLAALTGLSLRTVGYRLDRLSARGLIKPMVVINPGALGFTSYKMYFSIAPTGAAQRQRVLHDIAASEEVAFLHELGGEHEYEMILCVRDIGEVAAFLERLGSRDGPAISRKALLVQGGYIGFGKKYLTGKTMPAIEIPIATGGRAALIDALDHQLLRAVSAGLWSVVQLAVRLKISRTTAAFRLNRLRRDGLITGYIYAVSARSFGMQSYRMLLSVRSIAPKFHARLRQFCERHLHIVNLVATFGGWDYEVAVDVSDQRDLPGISRDLLQAFPREIEAARVVPLFETLKVENYPFRTLPERSRSAHIT